MNCDFHCHSTVSDGLLSPEALVCRAVDRGVDRLALTDHDDTSGLDLARATAGDLGIDLVNGVEISIEWRGTSVHVVGLAFDPSSPALQAGLAQVRGGRVDRARRMAEALEKVGIGGAFEGAMKFAENPSLISRAHFARFLVAAGVCADVHRVFESYLVPGKPGYVEHQWASLIDAVGWITGAGGVAVVAHPARYRISGADLRKMLAEFRDLGGQAIEVASGSHSPDQTALFARLAREFGFMGSRGSDFHGPGESWTDLGRTQPLPDGVLPVWSAF